MLNVLNHATATGKTVFAVTSMLAVSQVTAAFVWNNPAGGTYSAPGNWREIDLAGNTIGGGPPTPGQQVIYNYLQTNSFTVDVDIAATHGPTQFASPGTSTVTFNITGPGYSIPSQVKIGSASTGVNNVVVSGSNFAVQDLEIVKGSLTLNGPMDAGTISVGGTINVFPRGQSPGSSGTLTLNPGADLTVGSIWCYNAGAGSSVVFNGGTLTVQGDSRFNGVPAATLTQIGDGTNAAVLNLENSEFAAGQHSFGVLQTITISNNATINYNSPGGTLFMGNVNRVTGGANPGVFNWTAGHIGLSSSFHVTSAGQFGPSVELTSARSITVSGNTNIGGIGSLVLNGGALETDTLANVAGGAFTYLAGSLEIQTGDLAVGPTGITNPTVVSIDDGDSIEVSGTLAIAAGRGVDVNGGMLIAGSVVNNGSLSFHDGYLQIITGDLSLPVADHPNINLAADQTIELDNGNFAVEPTQSLTITGGSLTIASLTNNGTTGFISGDLSVTDGDLTIGPTGDINDSQSITVDGDSSIQVNAGTLAVQPTQDFTIDGGFVSAKTLVVNSDVSVASGALNAGAIFLGGVGGSGSLAIGSAGSVRADKIASNHLIVDGGYLEVTGNASPPGEEDPMLDNSIAVGYQDSALTVNDGYIFTPNLKIGVTPGFVGAATINGGLIQTNNLIASAGAESVVTFNGGMIETGHSEIDGAAAFVVGNGVNEARLHLVDGWHAFADGLTLSASGYLSGQGTVLGDVAVGVGTIEPGFSSSAAWLHVTGAVQQSPGSTLNVDLGGAEAGITYDEFHVFGSIAIDGTLAISLIDAFVPSLGDEFHILRFDSRSGDFDDITGDHIGQGLFLKGIYSDTELVLVTTQAGPGDADLDGDVDFDDLSILATNYGAVGGLDWIHGDFDHDSGVTLIDLTILATYYSGGQSQAFADFQSLAAVPEPGGVAAMGMMILGCLLRGRRRRQVTAADRAR